MYKIIMIDRRMIMTYINLIKDSLKFIKVKMIYLIALIVVEILEEIVTESGKKVGK